MLPDLDIWIWFYAFLKTPIIKESGLASTILNDAQALDSDTLEMLATLDAISIKKQRDRMEKQNTLRKARSRQSHGRDNRPL